MKSIYLYFFLLLVNLFPLSVSSTNSSNTKNELYVVLLIDASTSMLQTDPVEYRKMASQAITSLISPTDHIAVIQFASNAEVLTEWVDASQIDPIFKAINHVDHSGNTDFLDGLNKASELFKDTPKEAKKVILLFSDGELYPNPSSNLYYPLNNEWKLRTFGLSQRNKQQLFESKYIDQYRYIARKKIDEDVLVRLRNDAIEIYSIGFSNLVDKSYLEYISNNTSRSHNESRFFYVEKPTDLTQAFLAIIPYWYNKVILYNKEIDLAKIKKGSFFVDEFIKNVTCFVISDNSISFSINSTSCANETPIANTHPNIYIYPLKGKTPPADWNYNISGVSGKCRILVVGESTLRIEVINLHPQYLTGEELDLDILLKVGDQNAIPMFNKKPLIQAELYKENKLIDSYYPSCSDYGFKFKYIPRQLGEYKLRFTLKALDNKGREMLPRPTKEYRFLVLPNFNIQPTHLNFGDVRSGSNKTLQINVHNGFNKGRIVSYYSQITKQTNETDNQYLPIVSGNFTLKETESKELPIEINIPKSKFWGYYEGNILFETDCGERQNIAFEVHVPSWKEKIGYILTPLLILLIALVAFLLYKWSNLKTPTGILRPIEYPLGTIMDDIKLSRVKRGFWSRYLNWKKNEVKIGSKDCDIRLPDLSSQMKVRLLFFRFGRDYIKNESLKESELIISVEDQDVGLKIDLFPEKSYSISNGMKIQIGEYTFLYMLT